MKVPRIFNENNYYNSRAFFERCPDLAPKNMYMFNTRVIRIEDINRYFDEVVTGTKVKKHDNFIKKLIKRIFNKGE